MKIQNVMRKFYLFSFLSGMHMFSAVLVPFYTDWGGVGMFVAQSLQSWFMFCVFMLEVPTGVIADMIGRKKSLALGSLVSAFAALIYGSYPNLALFIIAEFLFAVGVAFMSGADRALIYDALMANGKKEKSIEVFGKSRSMHLMGIAFGAFLGGIISKYFGVNYPMLLTSIPSICAGITAMTIPEPKNTGEVQESRNFISVLKSGFEPLKNSKVLRRWTINATLVASASYFVIWLYQPVMEKIGIPIEYFGLAHAGLVFGQILIATNLRKIINFFGSQKSYLKFSAAAVSISMFLVAVWPNLWTLILLLGLAGGFGLTRMELMTAEMNRLIDSKSRSTTLSAISMVTRITNASLNPLVGFLTDKSVVFSLLAVSLLPLLTIFVKIKEKDTDIG